MDALEERGIPLCVTPGVSAFSGAAAALKAEYTLPQVSQSVIITRMEGRTPVPERERLREMARHGCTMTLFLSTGLLEEVERELLAGGAYTPDTPAAIVYKASWPVSRCSAARWDPGPDSPGASDYPHGTDYGRSVSGRCL